MANNLLSVGVMMSLLSVSAISILHIFPVFKRFVLSTFQVGIIGWIGLIATLLFLCRHYFGKALLIFILFFIVGYVVGPFLEPPGDPIDHLNRAYATQNKTSDRILSKNHGFWHYSMAGVVLYSCNSFDSPDKIMRRINILNGIFWGLGMVSLYILGRSVSLPDQWIWISMVVALVFFGTNRFSYFTYYSFAPSFTSMMIYWLWAAVFFLKRNAKEIFFGLLIAGLCLPILVANHYQEAVFLSVLIVIWILSNIYERLCNKDNGLLNNTVIIALSVTLFFILPQLEVFRDMLSQVFIVNDWEKNQDVVLSLWKIHLFGKVWSHRVGDTLGLAGFLPLLFLAFFLWPGVLKEDQKKAFRIILLGLIPFFVFFIPLFHYIWVSNCKWTPYYIRYYYRICYTSMFWVPIAFILYRCEILIQPYLKQFNWMSIGHISQYVGGRTSFSGFGMMCLITVLALSGIRSAPFYGKLDFILLDSKAWEREWGPLLDSIIPGRQMIYTDRMTSNVLSGVYNHPVVTAYYDSPGIPGKKNVIIDMFAYCKTKSCRSIVNLHGFKPSWVPVETGHWSPEVADTSLYYTHKNKTGENLIKFLKNNQTSDYEIFY